jgi:cytochrome c biogenesis protein CcmG, thiol:disulfide interchange protein DsbE
MFIDSRTMKTLIAILFIAAILVPLSAFAVNAGDVAPEFSLHDVNGSIVTLNSFKGMVVFLTFWATWCPSCKEELPDLNTLQQKFADKGFTVLSICIESSDSIVANYLMKHPVIFPVLVDKKGAVAETFRFSGLPASFMVGKDGIIRHKYSGYDKEAFTLIEQKIIELLNK